MTKASVHYNNIQAVVHIPADLHGDNDRVLVTHHPDGVRFSFSFLRSDRKVTKMNERRSVFTIPKLVVDQMAGLRYGTTPATLSEEGVGYFLMKLDAK